ncbi:hypothetical protein CEUSTIGMA_g12536.t1 [Chlamydomonas eustigma]|uniref:SM/Sec1-family protein n=1 Tax=Chlamydomonas eustigma TaxID=1157962 RepID=A0A250XPZ9_9CHLO|nr:hypothetical protein CEUSTIGMA_g12536.t1 [Chlamydomonas eustigma]|eukprot:GAX85116.1 hypothetical protein CEUSTIGMA_g12536.t1 [Chlamydomonas eustigma]
MAGQLNLRRKQTDAIVRFLNFNSQSSTTKEPSELYKVLVLDRFTKDIIAPLLRVSDLRRHSVTLHLLIEAERSPIPDVPAVYFLQPTEINMEKLSQDAKAALYDVMHLNFTTTLPSRYMEQLALSAVRNGCVPKIGKIFDQYLSFVALEANLFSLALPNAYVELNDPTATDYQIEASVARIVDGLFSVLVTLGVVPIIRCPKGGAAEHVARLLDGKLRDALRMRCNLFNEGNLGITASMTRPLLCLFDRNFDLSAALQHSWTYKPLVQDVLGMKLNRVTVAGAAGPGPSSAAAAASKKSYDVDERDFFWETCGAMAFPKLAEEVEAQLNAYRAAVEEINNKANAGPQDGVPYDPDDLLHRNTQNLMSAVTSLPELQEKKKVLDKHTNLATALLVQIKSRALDQYHSLGEDLLTGKGDASSVLKLIQAGKGSPSDKLRLVVLWLLICDGLPTDEDLQEMDSAVRTTGVDMSPLLYVQSLKRNNMTGSKAGGVAVGESSTGLSALTKQTNLLDWADKTFGQGLSHVTKSMKTLLSGARQVPMTAALEALMDGKPGSLEYEQYTIFDPKMPAGRSSLDHARGAFKEAVVFVIGGGNYQEREVLSGWASRCQPPKQLVFGATEMLSGEEFLMQLGDVWKRSNAT